MRKWEYKLLDPVRMDRTSLQAALDQAGREGWEAVTQVASSAVAMPLLLMKRELVAGADTG